MSHHTPNEEDIFQVARRIEPPDARAAYLDQVCGADQFLHGRVLALLGPPDEVDPFLETPPSACCVENGATADQRLSEHPGTRIGTYKLLQQIGEGGMGVVFMAEQLEPVRRKVAIKIVKPGMDSRQVIARFEAEKQALSLIDHVNIARVFDAGATDNGRPYFVMELVHGVPITEYCDDNRLTPRERLELFVPVCQAIQHAHQKGIIHRDIKPSNVMITLYDGKPVPKVIDFGVAKATEQKLTEQTLFADVQRYLNNEPVLACPPSTMYRVRKLVRRNQGLVLAASLLLSALLGRMIGTTLGMFRAASAQAVAVHAANEKDAALTAIPSMRSSFRFSQDDLRLAGAVHDGQIGIWHVSGGPEFRSLIHNATSETVEYLRASVHDDGRLLAIAMNIGFGIWDLSTGSELAFIPGGNRNNQVLFEPSGSLLTLSTTGLARWPVATAITRQGKRDFP